ncbi:hypothetical protein CKO09_03450 [Chromatium weissei]|nr:hypothetical protein [Chromatium weissei]
MWKHRLLLSALALFMFDAAAEENPSDPPVQGGFPFSAFHLKAPEEFATTPAYRFRGDPPFGQRDQRFSDDTDTYHFRPLSEREKAQRQSPFGWRPLNR